MTRSPATTTHTVEVYTDTLKIIGTLDSHPARRVSDALNQKEHSFLSRRSPPCRAERTRYARPNRSRLYRCQ